MSSKAIFIGGVPRSGTTLMRRLLGNHREIASFGETKLLDDPVFPRFPRWVYECPPEDRACLINVFKRLCLTRFFHHQVEWQVSTLWLVIWHRFRAIWLSRFQCPQSFLWRNPVWAALEKLWLTEAVQGHTFGLKIPDDVEAQHNLGLRGLYYDFSQQDIQQVFTILDELEGVTTLDDAYRAYGRFWNILFSAYAQREGKRYWAEKTPGNVLHIEFYERCFDGLKIINVVRDGRDVACSNVEQEWGKRNLKKALDSWASWLMRALEEQEKVPREHCLNVRYEDLVLQTRTTLRCITDFLGVNFDEGMLAWRIYSGSIGRYQDIMDPDTKAYAKERYGTLLRRWGYSA